MPLILVNPAIQLVRTVLLIKNAPYANPISIWLMGSAITVMMATIVMGTLAIHVILPASCAIP